ncbi:ribosomal large subunit pseudouridine synthase D [Geminocystis sp. NIES-3708]|uniref:RluA family pseudouridine synthase n=1 Tax=Geminocystis sp. NIES-3708 TaxID=1615909 RepID=UPI0005FC583E|nr:RluA family pseudouridine synthase [Geminocystis sp. NIES-3708]BAQ62750.1 ribosomal large subunit pseudouridine synthase D [Geminocystis sp. NIES-3708]
MLNTTSSLFLENSQESLTVTTTGERIDVWLADHLASLSRSRIQKLIEDGQVLLNKSICTQKKTILKENDQIVVHIPPPVESSLIPEVIPLDILYEDEYLIIINKPANFVVHPAPGHSKGTLVNALLAHCPDLQGIGGVERPGIVHRLDKDTTGAIMVAKTEPVLHSLQSQIKAKTATREYLGVVYGSFSAESGMIDLPIGRHPADGKKMAIVPVEKGGREAVTYWKVKEKLGNYSLIHFTLGTGRTHQIRVHASHLRHPILGDPLYSAGHFVGVNLTGQALHAFRLTVTHPITQERIEAIAPLPLEFETLLRILREKSGNKQ